MTEVEILKDKIARRDQYITVLTEMLDRLEKAIREVKNAASVSFRVAEWWLAYEECYGGESE